MLFELTTRLLTTSALGIDLYLTNERLSLSPVRPKDDAFLRVLVLTYLAYEQAHMTPEYDAIGFSVSLWMQTIFFCF